MSTTCDLCSKRTTTGRNRSHAQNRTARLYKANVHKVTMNVGEEKVAGNFCSKCIKRIRKDTVTVKTA